MESGLQILVRDYYERKISQFGASPKGVDWNSEESQTLRFEKLTFLLDQKNCFTINDIGCGYGRLVQFLEDKSFDYSYCGWDLSEKMITKAKMNHKDNSNVEFLTGTKADKIADYTIASGIFNVRQIISDKIWLKYILKMLNNFDSFSLKGFAFNCLSSYSDEDKKKDYLYYADPIFFFDYCKRNYSKNVSLLHDYDLYEFTMIVKK